MKLILSLLFTIVITVFASDGPTNEVDAKDYADPQLKNFDKRVWKNLLKYYAHARQIAKGTLNELKTIQDFCWSSYRYLYAIERAANRAKLIWDNITNFKAENPIDAIIYLEEDVFQKSDLLLKSDIPSIKYQRDKFRKSRDAVRNRTANHLTALNELLPDGLKFQHDYLRLMEINSPDSRMLDNDNDKDVNFHTSVLSQASRQIASAEVINEFSDNQSAILESSIKNATNNGASDPLHQSELSKIGERNSLLLSLQENVQLSDAVKTDAFFLMIHTKRFADQLAVKQALFCVMEDFSEKLLQVEADK